MSGVAKAMAGVVAVASVLGVLADLSRCSKSVRRMDNLSDIPRPEYRNPSQIEGEDIGVREGTNTISRGSDAYTGVDSFSTLSEIEREQLREEACSGDECLIQELPRKEGE